MENVTLEAFKSSEKIVLGWNCLEHQGYGIFEKKKQTSTEKLFLEVLLVMSSANVF